MTKKRRSFTETEKADIVKLVVDRGSIADVAKEKGIPYSMIHRWKNSMDTKSNVSPVAGRGLRKKPAQPEAVPAGLVKRVSIIEDKLKLLGTLVCG